MSQPGDPNNPHDSGERPPQQPRPVPLRPGETPQRPGDSLSTPLPPPLRLQPLTRPGSGPPPGNPPSIPLAPNAHSGPPLAPGPGPGPGPGPSQGQGFPLAGNPGQSHGIPLAGNPHPHQGPPLAGGPGPGAAPPSGGLAGGQGAGGAQPIQFQRLELKGQQQQPRSYAPPSTNPGPPQGHGVPIPPRPQTPPPAPMPTVEVPPEDVSGVVPRGWPPPRVSLGGEGSDSGSIRRPAEAKATDSGRFLPGPESTSRSRLNESRVEAQRAPLGPPPDLEDGGGRGGVVGDAQASWGNGKDPRPGTRSSRQEPRSNKGPMLLVGLFAVVLVGVLAWPPKSQPAQQVTETPFGFASETPGPLGVIPTSTPLASETPLFSPTAAPETPAAPATSQPLAVETTVPQAVETAAPASATPAVPASPTPAPVAVQTPKPVSTPKPTKSPKPRATEAPPAKDPNTFYSVRVYVTPSNADCKVYLVGPQRYMEQGAGSIRLQPSTKGSYKLKVVASGYETFSKSVQVEGDHNLAVRLEKIPPPPEPVYQAPAPAPYNPAPAPAPYYPPAPAPAPAPAPGSYQIPAPGI